MLVNNDYIYYDRELFLKLYRSGDHLNQDLVSLYHMAYRLSKYSNLSNNAKKRLKWMDYYRDCKNASQTCRHFDTPKKTFYKWLKRYDPNNLYTLEDQDKTPINKRQREITPEQERRIIKLRKEYIRYSKIKIAKIYEDEYGEYISSWKVQKVIEKYKLYFNPAKTAKTTKKRLKAVKKKKITELKKRPKSGFLICLDAIEFRMYGIKRYVFTAIDYFSKVAFARMYKRASSYNAADFLNRLLYLIDGKVENIQTDNGSEFEKYFSLGLQKMKLDRYYNRPRTPKDNPVNERFNRTLQEEFVDLGNYTDNTLVFNKNLTEWLIEYNFKRPHMSLNYETPINFNNSVRVSPMYPSHTKA
jgi:transposase InsO family protein